MVHETRITRSELVGPHGTRRRYLHDRVAAALGAGEPVISVTTKQKVLIGNYTNGGSDWRPEKNPERVNTH